MKNKKIYQFTPDGELVKEWADIREILLMTDYQKLFIEKQIPIYHGYIWRYYPELTEDDLNITPIYEYDVEGELIKKWDCEYTFKYSKGVRSCKVDELLTSRCKHILRTANKSNNIYMKNKKVEQRNKKGKLIRKWNNITQIQNELSISPINMLDCGDYYKWVFEKQVDKRVEVRKVYQINKYGYTVANFANVSEAARSVGGARSNISACCKGKIKSAYGFNWSYKKGK